MQRFRACSVLALMLLLAMGMPSFATNYHVDAAHASASDANPGTVSAPLRSIARGAELAMAGDTVFIAGLYHEVLNTQRSGSDGFPIVFAAARNAEAILDGGSGAPGNNGVLSTDSWLHFEGLEIRNWYSNGMWFEGGGHILIRDCDVHDMPYGIGMTNGCHDFVLERVVMHHFDLYGFDASPGPLSCHDGTFVDCVAHTGRDPEQNVDGFALGHGEQRGFVFRNCETYGVFDGFDISSRETTLESCSAHDCINGGYKLWQDDILLVNCLAYRNGGTNVELDWDGDPGSVTLWNCSFHEAGNYNIWVENSADTLFMYNCIVTGGDVNGLAFEQRDARNYFGDYNLFHNDTPHRMIVLGYEDEYSAADLGAWTARTGQDAHSIALVTQDGVYVDALGCDLHLVASSPARDKGRTAGAPSVDFDGMPRPDGPAVDIGAYEFQSAVRIARPFEALSFSVFAYPNPSEDGVHFFVSADRAMPCELSICDLSGRLLHLSYRHLQAGRSNLIWDGTDAAGLRVRGTCFAMLRTPAGNRSVRLSLR